MALKDPQLKLMSVGLGLLAQFAAMVYLYVEFKIKTELEIKQIVSEQERRAPLVDRFLGLEQRTQDYERRLQTVERSILWLNRQDRNRMGEN